MVRLLIVIFYGLKNKFFFMASGANKKLLGVLVFLMGISLIPLNTALASKDAAPWSGYSNFYHHPAKNIIHTVEKNENLWHIAKFFDVDLSSLAKLNNIENPDRIFPGDKLTIQIQDDFSLRVTTSGPFKQPQISLDEDRQKNIFRVTYPSREDIFSPENPLVEARPMKILAGPRQSFSKNSIVFKTFYEFVEWFIGGKNFRTVKAAGSPNIDPSPSAPHYFSRGPLISPVLNDGGKILAVNVAYQPYIPDLLKPPPKSL